MSEGSSMQTRPPERRSVIRDWRFGRLTVVVIGSIASLAGSTLVSLLPLVQESRVDYALEQANDQLILWLFVLQAVLVAPVVETGLMAIVVFTLRRGGIRNALVVGFVATLFALTHQSFGVQAASVLPSFLVFSFVYVWRTTPPFSDGFALTTLVHTINNLVPAVVLVVYRYASDP